MYSKIATLGRGAHRYIFLSEPLQQPKAYWVMKAIVELSWRLGLSKPDIKPSAPYQPGTSIFLPYWWGFGVSYPSLSARRGSLLALHPRSPDAS